MENLNQWLQSTFKEGAPMVTMILILGLAALAFIITLIILRRVVTRIVRKTKTVWDDALLESKFFFWLAQLAPGAVFYKFASLFASEPTRIPLAVAKQPGWGAFSQQASKVYMIVVGYLAFSALLSGILEIYQKSSNVPIRGFLQVVKLIASYARLNFCLPVTFLRAIKPFVSG